MHAHGHGHTGADGDRLGIAGADPDSRRLGIALGLVVALMAGEVVVGVLASSLALLSDAGHMLVDAAALAAALVAIRLAQRPARGRFTYGLHRAEILSAQFNGVTLLVLGALIVYGAVRRLVSPPDVAGGAVLAVALAGIGVNLLATWVLAGANRASLNVEGAFRHVATDLAAFVATAVAGGVILASGFDRADGIAALVIAALMFWAAYGLLRESGRVFLEAAPAELDPSAIGRALAAEPGVVEVHDLHVWEVTSGFPALSAHVLVGRDTDCHRARRELEQLVAERFHIDHTTLQVEHEGGELIELERRGPAQP